MLKATFLAAYLAIGATTFVFAGVIAPDQSVSGISQAELSARWWQWMMSYPNGMNPVLDDHTGQFSYRGSDQTPVSHPGVFFLAGNFSGAESRTVTITDDQSLFFPLINAVSLIPFFGNTEAEIRADAAWTLGTVSELYARLDGVDLPLPAPTTSLSEYRQQSQVFSLTFPDNNIYDFLVAPGSYDTVADGYWLALGPLAPGDYTLTFGAHASGTPLLEYPEFILTQTYTITIVPEPATCVLLAAGLIGIGAAVQRRKLH